MLEKKVYKFDSFNQTLFCFEIKSDDCIRVWREDKDGTVDKWWNQWLSPEKCEWLIRDWNNGKIPKWSEEWYETNIEKQARYEVHINNLRQLNMKNFIEVLEYYAAIIPHYRWTSQLRLNTNVRPLFYRGHIDKFVDISKEKAIEHNIKEKKEKRFRYDMFLYGSSDDEIINCSIK